MRVWLLVLALVVVGAIGGTVVWALGQRQDLDQKEDRTHPLEWDARVRAYAEAVEEHRGLDFEHPVHVDFLSVPAFRKQVTQDEGELTRQDREDIEHATGLFRALGLLEGDVDLFETVNELQSAGIVGYYDDEDQRIRVRGTELTPTVRSTLVHELTHALQDQHFGIGKRMRQLEKSEDANLSGYRAVVEGDASRIESKWRAELGRSELAALEEAEAAERRRFQNDAAEVPEVLATLMGAPYVLGEPLTDVAERDGGAEAVDALFEARVITEEHELDPWTLVADEQGATEVDTPDLADGEEKYDDGPFGALGWLLVLAERIPAAQALEAADGWGGDAYVSFRRDGVDCVRIDYRAETARDLAQMRSAATAWMRKQPASRASVEEVDGRLHVESCAPPRTAPAVATGGSREALQLAASRTYLSLTLLGNGFDTAEARCGADRLLRTFTVAELNGPGLDVELARQVIVPCLA